MNILNIGNHNPHTAAVKTVEKSSNIQAKTSLPFNHDKDESGVVLNISNRALQLSKHPMFALNKSILNGLNIAERKAGINGNDKGYGEQSLSVNDVDGDNAEPLLQNFVLDSVDEFLAKTANEMCQADLKAMALRTDMAMFLIKGLGITSGHIDISETGIAKMMERYRAKLQDGTLSENAEIRELDVFDKFCEKYYKDLDAANNDFEAYTLLWQNYLQADDPIKQLFNRDNMEIDAGSLVERGATTTPTTPANPPSGEPFDFFKALRAGMQARVDAAEGEEKKDLEMRLYSYDYCQIFSGGRPDGWRNLDMEMMYSQADEIYKQIEESSDSEETKDLKRQALKNALQTGTGFYSMNKVIEKMRNDALEAEAQGKAIDRSYRSKVKFDKLCEISGALHNITSMFFNNLKNGKAEGVDYGFMITDAVNKMMSYRHPS